MLHFFGINAQKLLINEISQGVSGNKEFVEFIVNTAFPSQCPDINECVDLRGWIIDDNNSYFSNGVTSGVGFAQGAVRFSNNAFWSCLKPGTLITIYDDSNPDAVIPPDDASTNDGNCSLVLPITSNLFEKHLTLPDPNGNTGYSTTGWEGGGQWSLIAMQNDDDSFQVIDPNNTTSPSFSVSYGNNTFNNMIYFAGEAQDLSFQCTNSNSNNFFSQNNWISVDANLQSPGNYNSAENELFAQQINAVCRTPFNATVSFTDDICGGACDGTAQVDQVTGGVLNYSYLWSNSETTTSISGLCAGDHSLTVTDASNCEFVVDFTIASNGSPEEIQVNADVTICEGESTTLTATGPSDVIWQNIGVQGLSINVSPTITTTYTAEDIQANSCFSPNDVTVTVLPSETIGISAFQNPTTCGAIDGSITISGSSTGDLTWTGTSSGTLSNITLPSTINNLSSGTYNISFTGLNLCESNAVSQSLTDPNAPTVPIILVTGNNPFCEGESIVLTSSFASSYLWSTGETTQSITVSSSGDYFVSVTENSCTSTSTVLNVNENPLPILTVENLITLCDNAANYTMTFSPSGGQWSGVDVSSNGVINPNTLGSHTLTYTYSDGNCSNTATSSLEIIASPIVYAGLDIQICDNQSVTLNATGSDSYQWDNGVQNNIPFNVTQTNTYTVIGTNTNNCTATDQVTVFVTSLPPINLGPDFVSCDGSSCNVNINNTYDYLQWNDGSNDYSRTFDQNGTYSVTAWSNAENIINFGDFSAGTTNTLNQFSTSYALGTPGAYGLLTNAGTYAISTSPSLVHTNFFNCGDHTTGNGNMLICNGSNIPNTPVWCQTVAVQPNTDYSFSCWAMNAITNPEVSSLQFFINGVQLGDVFQTDVNGCVWNEFYSLWNSGSNNTAELCIYNQSTIEGGNDFALDDIYFSPICSETDEISVFIEEFSVQAGADQSICQGEDIDLQGVINQSNNFEEINFSNTLDTPIFDNFSSTSTINVSGINYTGSDSPIASLCININHSYTGDLDISLICPDGTSIDLTSDNGGSSDNYTNTCFDEISANITTGSGPFTGTFSPEQAFSLLNTCTINGIWTLQVSDDGAGDIGTLLDWSITFKNDLNSPNFSWNPTDFMQNSTTLTPTVNPDVTTTYTLSATSASGFCQVSDDVVINVQAGGDASFSFAQDSYCQTETNPSPTITTAGGTFTSSPAGLVFLDNLGTIDLLNSMTGTYTITYTLNVGCNTVHNETVSIADNPTVDPVDDIGICSGATLLEIQFTGSNGTTFQWSNDNTNTNIPASGTDVLNTTVVANSSSNTISSIIEVTPVAGTCFGQAITFTIDVYPVESLDAGDDFSVCQNEEITLSGISNLAITWDNNVIDNVAFIPNNTQTYTATVETINNCITTDQITVTVLELPEIIMPQDTAFCYADPIFTFQGNPSGGTWTGVGVSANGQFDASIPTTNQNEILTYSYTDVNSCSNSSQMNVLVHPLPIVDAGQDLNICFGALISLNASGAQSYIWDNGIVNGEIFSAFSGIFTVIGIDEFGCKNTDQLEVVNGDYQLNPIPDITACQGDTVIVQTGNAQIYEWSPTYLVEENQNIASIVVQQHDVIQVFGYHSGCLDTITFEVFALQTPLVYAGENIRVCIEDSIQLLAQGNADYYIWNSDIPDSTFVFPTEDIVYTLTGYIGTCSKSDELIITTALKPDLVNFTDSLIGCVRLDVPFDISVSPDAQIHWDFDDGTYSTEEDPLHTYIYEGIPRITVTAYNEYCMRQLHLDSLIQVLNVPIADFGVDVKELSQINSTVNFTNFSYFATDYEWHFGDSSTSTEIHPNHHYQIEDDKNIVVQLIASNHNVCSDTAIMIIEIFPDDLIFVPNTFTPDGDEFNNTFKPQVSGIKENTYHLTIYNRWGEILFESFDVNIGWDGTYKEHEICKTDTYVWKIEYKTQKGLSKNKHGSFTLLK